MDGLTDTEKVRNKGLEEAAGILLGMSRGQPYGLMRMGINQILEARTAPRKRVHFTVERVEDDRSQNQDDKSRVGEARGAR